MSHPVHSAGGCICQHRLIREEAARLPGKQSRKYRKVPTPSVPLALTDTCLVLTEDKAAQGMEIYCISKPGLYTMTVKVLN